MTPKAINAAIDAIIARAPDLRRAGITELSVGDLSLTIGAPLYDWPGPGPVLADADAKNPLAFRVGTPPPADAPQPDPVDPLNDAATYPGGRVPGFQRPKE